MKKLLAIFLICSCFVYGEYTVETLSESPKIALISNFLSDEECAYLIEAAQPRLARSEIVDNDGVVEGVVDERRTSEGAYLTNFSDRIVQRIERRIARLTNTLVSNGEPMEVLHYGVGGEFKPHHDYFDASTPGGQSYIEKGGQRQMSLVIYLKAPEKGGETVFPEAHISVVPKKGNALLFYDCLPNGEIDPLSLHGGAPVVEGEKWIANKWIRTGKWR